MLINPNVWSNQSKRPIAKPMYRPAIGRFAPSPTGELHLGSLTTAIASYCHIKSCDGRWLLRMEDTDTNRCSQQFSDQIMIDLERLGLHWDGQVTYQSERTNIYNDLLHSRLSSRSYGCTCTRKQLAGFDIYPRFCLKPLNTNLKNNSSLSTASSVLPNNVSSSLSSHLPNNITNATKIRFELPDYLIGYIDHLQGMQWVNPQRTLGDVVLKRANGIVNYFLAVSVDDGLQGVTHVMRGLDILPLTTAQIAIMQYLDLPIVKQWYHLPLVENKQGQKLSKQNLATPIDTSDVKRCQQLIHQALALLKQPPVDTQSPANMLVQAIAQWQNTPLMNETVLGRV